MRKHEWEGRWKLDECFTEKDGEHSEEMVFKK